MADWERAFDLLWFVPELLRQRRLLFDVTIAALFLYALGLATPLFFQLVIDKVLVNQSRDTLYVLGPAGITIALVFDAGSAFLRRYLLLYASNKVDIRVGPRTFGHLLSPPVGFFETAPAGVLVKHMQQTARIGEFLTGRLFPMPLDLLSLLVFVPVLLLYSLMIDARRPGLHRPDRDCDRSADGPFSASASKPYEAGEEHRVFVSVESIHGMQTAKALQ